MPIYALNMSSRQSGAVNMVALARLQPCSEFSMT